MRVALLRRRVPGVQPLPLVRVFKVLFESYYGGFRLLTCPTFGLTRELIKEFCEHGCQITRALSSFLRFGPFRFAGGWAESVEMMGYTLKDNIYAIKCGHGEEIVDVIMRWIQVVQLRAMQDVARHDPERFTRMWCTKHWEHWAESQSKEWRRHLSFREDRDLGCVLRTDVPDWSAGVAEKIRVLRGLICDTESAIIEDDDAMWNGGMGVAHVESAVDVAANRVSSSTELEEWTPFPVGGAVTNTVASESTPPELRFDDDERQCPVRELHQDGGPFGGLQESLLVSETRSPPKDRAGPDGGSGTLRNTDGCNTVESVGFEPDPPAALEACGDRVESDAVILNQGGDNQTLAGGLGNADCPLTMTQVQRSSHVGQLYPDGTFRQDVLMCSQWCDNVSEPRRVLHTKDARVRHGGYIFIFSIRVLVFSRVGRETMIGGRDGMSISPTLQCTTSIFGLVQYRWL